jgi:hypothetical protein
VRSGTTKCFTCGRCGRQVAEARFRGWFRRMQVTGAAGSELVPSRGQLHLRLAEQALAQGPGLPDAEMLRSRLRYVVAHTGDLIYELACAACGYSVLRTAPDLIRTMRRHPGRWISTADLDVGR